MPFEIQTGAGGSTLTLSGRLGVQQARPLWDALQSATALSPVLMMQAGAIEEIDTSIVQILCRAMQQGIRLHISGASDGFLLSLERRGMEKYFLHSRSTAEVPRQTSPTADEPDGGRPVKRRSQGMSKTSSSGRSRRA